MPRYELTAEDQEDMYPSEASSTSTKSPESETKPEDEEEESTAPTAIIDNKVLQGPDGEPPKEGDEIVVKVVKVYGDESEVQYSPKKSSAKSEDEMSSDAELESINREE